MTMPVGGTPYHEGIHYFPVSYPTSWFSDIKDIYADISAGEDKKAIDKITQLIYSIQNYNPSMPGREHIIDSLYHVQGLLAEGHPKQAMSVLNGVKYDLTPGLPISSWWPEMDDILGEIGENNQKALDRLESLIHLMESYHPQTPNLIKSINFLKETETLIKQGHNNQATSALLNAQEELG